MVLCSYGNRDLVNRSRRATQQCKDFWTFIKQAENAMSSTWLRRATTANDRRARGASVAAEHGRNFPKGRRGEHTRDGFHSV